MTPRSWRKLSKLTVAALSKKMGLAPGYVSEIERGVKPASGRALRKYHRLSKGQVTPGEFPVKKPKKARRLKRQR